MAKYVPNYYLQCLYVLPYLQFQLCLTMAVVAIIYVPNDHIYKIMH